MTLTILPWFTGIILAMALFFAMHHVRRYIVCISIEAHRIADCYTSIIRQIKLHGQCHWKPVFCRHHFCFYDLGGIRLDESARPSYVLFYLSLLAMLKNDMQKHSHMHSHT